VEASGALLAAFSVVEPFRTNALSSAPAEDGFNCTDRASFDAQSAKLAFDRSVEFFHQNVG